MILDSQGSNPGLPYCRQILYQLSHQGSPRILEWVAYRFSSGPSWPRNNPGSPPLQVDSLPTELSWKPCIIMASVQFSSFTQLCLTVCDLMDCSTPVFPVYHQLLEFTQTHVHWVGDAIQPSHPLSSPFPHAFNVSQHQGLFPWVSIRWPKYWTISFSIGPSNE